YKNVEGRPEWDVYLTLDMAKQLSMVEKNDKGKEARLYFIACEKELKRLLSQPPPKRPDPNFYLKRSAYKGISGLSEALLEVTGNMESEKGFAEYLYRQMNKPQPDNNIIPLADTKKRIR
ncbi:antA/AntB antirepressor family protein, partial [Candidatus Magnetobacterium casensis]|nr:antA/AntB antirepressor family protein [Candidatus Magnetobacterium casensis]